MLSYLLGSKYTSQAY